MGKKESMLPRRRRRWVWRAVGALVALLVACVVGFGVYASDYYHADSSVTLADARDSGGFYAVGDPDAAYGLVLYPGAKVDPAAYLPLAEDLADRGVFCAIAKMPLNFAIFNPNAAADVMAVTPGVGQWWIGGHSLGGVMAAQFAGGHAEELEGVVLLASYATTDLSGSSLAALSVYGTEDGVLNRESMAANEHNLPSGTKTAVVEGGNHAGFGAYGPQDGDGTATVSPDEQQEETADLIAGAMAAAA